MTDKELLELAAKAAGYEWYGFGQRSNQPDWNPLTDDGDAFRLAMKLKIDVEVHESEVWAIAADDISNYQLLEWHKDDKCAAARKAIVRVASQIGRRYARSGDTK